MNPNQPMQPQPSSLAYPVKIENQTKKTRSSLPLGRVSRYPYALVFPSQAAPDPTFYIAVVRASMMLLQDFEQNKQDKDSGGKDAILETEEKEEK